MSSAPCYKSCTILYTRLASRRAFLVLHLNDAVWQLEHSSSQYRVFTKIILFALQSISSYTLKIEMPHLSGPRRYFFHHSYKVLSLQNYPSLAGKTSGTRIEKYCSLVMPLVRKCKEQHALAHLYNRQARRLFARRLAARGSTSKSHVPYSLKKRSPDGERFSFLSAKLRRNFCFFLLCEEYAETNADADDYDARNDGCKKNRREIVLLCGESGCADFVNFAG